MDNLKIMWDSQTKVKKYLWVSALLLLIFVIDCSYNIHKKKIKMDFHYHYLASQALINGKDIYNKKIVGKKFKYFPINAILFVPFAIFNPFVSESLWLVVNLVMTFLIFKAGHDFFGVRLGKWWPLPILFVIDIFWENMKLGQINLSVFFFTVMGLIAFLKGNELKAGFSLGLASVLKFMPMVFIVYFAWKREWKVVKAALAAIFLLIFIVPLFLIGPRYSVELNSKYFIEGSNRLHRMTGTKRAYGQSMEVFIFSLLYNVDKSPTSHSPITINPFNIGKKNAQRVALFFCSMLFIIAFVMFSKPSNGGKYRYMWEFSTVFTLMLLISPEARNAHFLTLYIPFCSLISFLWEHKNFNWLRLVVMLSYTLLILRHKTFLGREMHAYMFAYSSMGISALIIFCTLLYLHKRVTQESIVRP